MNNFTEVWSLEGIKEFLKNNHLEGAFGSRQFRCQCYNLERKIPYEVYDLIVRLSGIDPKAMEKFEQDYKDYLLEYDGYLYRKALNKTTAKEGQ